MCFLYRAILGLLGKKTRVLCTHHGRFLSGASRVIQLEEGRIVAMGMPAAVLPRADADLFDRDNDGGSKPNSRKVSFDHPEEGAESVNDAAAAPDERETTEQGTVKFDIYKRYWTSVGNWLSPAILLSLAAMQVRLASRQGILFLVRYVQMLCQPYSFKTLATIICIQK